MESEQEILASLLKDRPDNFDELKDWANLQLAVRSATRKESFLQRIGGLATTVTAIIGVLTASITAIQLWNKIEDDRKDQVDRFRMEALKLYVDNWQQFSDPANCGRFTVFAAAVKDQSGRVRIHAHAVLRCAPCVATRSLPGSVFAWECVQSGAREYKGIPCC